jgi:hypothetical protein
MNIAPAANRIGKNSVILSEAKDLANVDRGLAG